MAHARPPPLVSGDCTDPRRTETNPLTLLYGLLPSLVTTPTFLLLAWRHWASGQRVQLAVSPGKQAAWYGLHGVLAGASNLALPYAGPALLSILFFLKFHYGISWRSVFGLLGQPIPQKVPALPGGVEDLKTRLSSENAQEAASAMQRIFDLTKQVAPVCAQYKDCGSCPYNHREGSLIKCGPYLTIQKDMIGADTLTTQRIVTGTMASFMETSSALGAKIDSLKRAQNLIRVMFVLVSVTAAGYAPRLIEFGQLFLAWVFG